MISNCDKKKYIYHNDTPIIELNHSCDDYSNSLLCDLCHIKRGSYISSGGYNSTYIIKTKDCSDNNCKKLRNHSGVLRISHKHLNYEEIYNEKKGLYLQSLFSTSKKKGGYGCSKYICKVYDFGDYKIKDNTLANELFGCSDEKIECKPVDFSFDTGVYGILEEISGGELFDRLVSRVNNSNSFKEKEVSYIIWQIISGLNCMHSNGYCHFDIKLENILLKGKSNNIKIIDFGFVNNIPKGDGYINPDDFGRAGTPGYKAPEVNFEERCNQKADMWSVGIVCIALLLERTNYEDVSKDPSTFTETLIPEIFFEKYDYELYNLPCGEPLSENGKDFLTKILVWDQNNRLSSRDALKHPWLKSYSENGRKINNLNKKKNINSDKTKKKKKKIIKKKIVKAFTSNNFYNPFL